MKLFNHLNFDCSAPPQKKERLILTIPIQEITGWVGPTKKDMGGFGRKILFLLLHSKVKNERKIH